MKSPSYSFRAILVLICATTIFFHNAKGDGSLDGTVKAALEDTIKAAADQPLETDKKIPENQSRVMVWSKVPPNFHSKWRFFVVMVKQLKSEFDLLIRDSEIEEAEKQNAISSMPKDYKPSSLRVSMVGLVLVSAKYNKDLVSLMLKSTVLRPPPTSENLAAIRTASEQVDEIDQRYRKFLKDKAIQEPGIKLQTSGDDAKILKSLFPEGIPTNE